jgi:hypothetical protein
MSDHASNIVTNDIATDLDRCHPKKKIFNHLSDLFKVGTLIDRRMFKGR